MYQPRLHRRSLPIVFGFFYKQRKILKPVDVTHDTSSPRPTVPHPESMYKACVFGSAYQDEDMDNDFRALLKETNAVLCSNRMNHLQQQNLSLSQREEVARRGKYHVVLGNDGKYNLKKSSAWYTQVQAHLVGDRLPMLLAVGHKQQQDKLDHCHLLLEHYFLPGANITDDTSGATQPQKCGYFGGFKVYIYVWEHLLTSLTCTDAPRQSHAFDSNKGFQLWFLNPEWGPGHKVLFWVHDYLDLHQDLGIVGLASDSASLRRFALLAKFKNRFQHKTLLDSYQLFMIVSFTDVFLHHTSAASCLIIVPINTLQNWLAEYNAWLPPEGAAPPTTLDGAPIWPRKVKDYLKSIAKLKVVIPIENTELLSKIHQTYRVQYIQDVEDERLLSELFHQLGAAGDTEEVPVARRRDLILFLKEFTLSSLGVLSTLEVTLGLEDSVIKAASIDVLSYIVEFSPSMTYLLTSSLNNGGDTPEWERCAADGLLRTLIDLRTAATVTLLRGGYMGLPGAGGARRGETTGGLKPTTGPHEQCHRFRGVAIPSHKLQPSVVEVTPVESVNAGEG
ncbi:Serine/threonine-protein phosphatase 4 regulatory subunit 3 [Chionoecetes opilio]|uniref:Serine/threonine-protein phosphatase 4 regulatory subunit 3 n=1 Tax=Chionoecetes opilio TaxID=41210 RepID=A0A8J5D155_CHIOP|nr:Serine/threonine-protein phosphatase 4 regulatory subunit 3 [Chionoecetes opilio]